MYNSFKTYQDIPRDNNGNSLFTAIRSYTDTADEGADFLCFIIYGVYNREAYVLEIIYTKAPMEETEILVAKAHYEYEVNLARVESNNGGKGFSRNVDRILKTDYETNRTLVKWFHQSKNKMARILTNATWIMNHIYYPVNWGDRWPEYYDAMAKYSREGKNKHDDAPDCTTGIAEDLCKKGSAILK